MILHPSKVYLQVLSREPANLRVVLFTIRAIELYRKSIALYNSIFVDATSNVVKDIVVKKSVGEQSLMFTAIHVPVPKSHARGSRPLRALTELSIFAEASTFLSSMLHYRKVERELFGNNRAPKYCGLDCGINIVTSV